MTQSKHTTEPCGCRIQYEIGEIDYCPMHHTASEMLEALQGILWKLERKESASGDGTDCKWARIDRNDATIEEARAAIRAATGGED